MLSLLLGHPLFCQLHVAGGIDFAPVRVEASRGVGRGDWRKVSPSLCSPHGFRIVLPKLCSR